MTTLDLQMRTRSHPLHPRRHCVEPLLEEHELGGSPTLNPGHPFKVGDVLLCDIPGQL